MKIKTSLIVALIGVASFASPAYPDFDWGSRFDQGDLKLKKNTLQFAEKDSDPSTPPSDNIKVYAKDSAGTTKLYTKDSAGTVTEVGSGSGSVSDDAYGAGWNGSTTTAPSQNAVYDKIEALVLGSGTGDVIGPASATNNAVALYDGTTGKLIKDSSVIVSSGAVTGVTTLNTGQGAYELYAMDQNVLTSSAPSFAGMTLTGDLELGNTPQSIDGGTSGLAFDPDNDGTNEATLSTAGVFASDGGFTSGASTDPGIVFDVASSGDTDYWISVDEDAGADDDDTLKFGTGTTKLTNSRLTLDNSGNLTTYNQADLRLSDSDGSNYAAIQAPATIASNYTLTLPDTDGDADQYLKTDGSGNLSWASVSGGSITGTDTHVMFFDGANTPAGEAGFTYNKTTDTATLAGDIIASGNDWILGTASAGVKGTAASGNFTLSSFGNTNNESIVFDMETANNITAIYNPVSEGELELSAGNRNPQSMVTFVDATLDYVSFERSQIAFEQAQSLTIADNGAGTAATDSSAPQRAYIRVTCNDANGCEWTPAETNMVTGIIAIIQNISASNSLVIKESAGITDIGGDRTLGSDETFTLIYSGTEWVPFQTPTSGTATPAGSDTQVQFNNAGSMGADSGLTYNSTTDALTIAGGLTVDTSTFAVDSTNDRIGVNDSSPDNRLDVEDGAVVLGAATTRNVTTLNGSYSGGDSSSSIRELYITPVYTGTADMSTLAGSYVITDDQRPSGTTDHNFGHVGRARLSGAGQNNYLSGTYSDYTLTDGTATWATNYYAIGGNLVQGGTATNTAGLYVEQPTDSGTGSITDSYGVFIKDFVTTPDASSSSVGLAVGDEPPASTVLTAYFTNGDTRIDEQFDLQFGDSDGSNYASIQAPATIGANYTLTLPTDDGTSGQYLKTDGSGALSWDTPSGGSGDVTAVGPGCATGACFTDGVTTTGSDLIVWEGSTSDANEFTISVPSDPAADKTATFQAVTGTLPVVIDRDVSNASLVNDTTETTMYTYTVPANTLGTNGMIRISYVGELLNNTGGSATLVVRVKLGSTTVFDSNTILAATNSSSERSLFGHCWIAAANATNAQVSGGQISLGATSTTGGQAGGAVFRPEAVHNTIAEDSTTDLTLSITFDFATASASLRADLNFVQTEKL